MCEARAPQQGPGCFGEFRGVIETNADSSQGSLRRAWGCFALAVSLLFKNPTPGAPFLSDLQAIAPGDLFTQVTATLTGAQGAAARYFGIDGVEASVIMRASDIRWENSSHRDHHLIRHATSGLRERERCL